MKYMDQLQIHSARVTTALRNNTQISRKGKWGTQPAAAKGSGGPNQPLQREVGDPTSRCKGKWGTQPAAAKGSGGPNQPLQ